jgi:hypothetical protein
MVYNKPKEKRPLGRTIRRWEDNIKVDRREKGERVMEWIHLAQDRPLQGFCEQGD